MHHNLPAEGAIDAVDHELAAGFDHRIDVVGVAGLVDRRDHRVLEIDRDFQRKRHAGKVISGLTSAVRGAGVDALEFAAKGGDRCASVAAFVSSARAGRLAAIETAAAATSLNIIVIDLSSGAGGG